MRFDVMTPNKYPYIIINRRREIENRVLNDKNENLIGIALAFYDAHSDAKRQQIDDIQMILM